MGFALGGFAEYAVNEKFSVRPELLYSMKGEKYSADNVDAAVELAYIDVPVLAVYRFPMEGNVRPGIYAGPMVSFKVSADATADGPGGSDSEEITTAESIDFAVVLGAEVTFQDRYFVEVRVANGFINADSESGDQDILNQMGAVMVGMSFDFPAK